MDIAEMINLVAVVYGGGLFLWTIPAQSRIIFLGECTDREYRRTVVALLVSLFVVAGFA